jgi:hypothetical protein
LQVNNGSSQRVNKFYTSDDGVSWTQLGTTVTTAGATSIFDSTSALEIGSVSLGSNNVLDGTVYRAIVQSAYDTADNTTSAVFDADFASQTADALAFTATSDMGIKADGLVLKGISGQYASTPDSAALSITGDIDIQAKVALGTWTPAADMCLVAKEQTTGTRCYRLNVSSTGRLTIVHSPDGPTALTGTSTVVTGLADGATKWVRVTLDVDDGSGNRVYNFYLSDDGAIWTQLGATVTTAGTTSLNDTAAPLEIGSRNLGVNTLVNGTVYRAIVKDGIDGATVFDADFDAQALETTSFTESSSNAATVTINGTNPTVTINTTRYSYGLPGVQSATVGTNSFAANTDFYFPFVVNQPLVVDMMGFEVTTGPFSSSTTYMAIYNADNNFQPTGSPVATASQVVAASTAGVGVYRVQITPDTLPAGSYLIAFNNSIGTGYRTIRGGVAAITAGIGTNPFSIAVGILRTAGTFTSSPPAWTVITTGTTASTHPIHLRYKAAT